MTGDWWPKAPTRWGVERTLYVSVPFTWNLPDLRKELMHGDLYYDSAVVGGPAAQLMPDYLSGIPGVSIGTEYPGVLQKINSRATKTTSGCIRGCKFCAVPRVEGRFQELSDWPNLPVITDNNPLAASREHFDVMIDRLALLGVAIFSQGLDTRILDEYHARRIREIKNPMVYLALDSMSYADDWVRAVQTLRKAKIPVKKIRSYAMIGFEDNPDHTPQEAWARCEFIRSHSIDPLPMWYHRLDALQHNIVTPGQEALGWTDLKRRELMQYYYFHKRAKGVPDDHSSVQGKD